MAAIEQLFNLGINSPLIPGIFFLLAAMMFLQTVAWYTVRKNKKSKIARENYWFIKELNDYIRKGSLVVIAFLMVINRF